MTVELTYEPTSPSTGDALYFTVIGDTDGETARITVSADGDELQASPEFGIEDAPEGTGADRFRLQITGGTFGTFTMGIYEYGDDPEYGTTDPIYYARDDVDYAFPDSDDLAEALEEALPGLEVTVERDEPAVEILLGGKFSGQNMGMTADTTGIAGSEIKTLIDAPQRTGPFRWGPVVLASDTYEVDVIYVTGDNAGNSLLDGGPIEIVIA